MKNIACEHFLNYPTEIGNQARKKTYKSQIKLTSAQRAKLEKVGDLWLRRMAHISGPYINQLPVVSEDIAHLLYSGNISTCVDFALAKANHKP